MWAGCYEHSLLSPLSVVWVGRVVVGWWTLEIRGRAGWPMRSSLAGSQLPRIPTPATYSFLGPTVVIFYHPLQLFAFSMLRLQDTKLLSPPASVASC